MPKRTLNPTPATAFFPPDHPIPCPFFFLQGVRHDLQLSPLRCIGTPDWTHPFSLELSAILIDPRYLPDYPVLLPIYFRFARCGSIEKKSMYGQKPQQSIQWARNAAEPDLLRLQGLHGTHQKVLMRAHRIPAHCSNHHRLHRHQDFSFARSMEETGLFECLHGLIGHRQSRTWSLGFALAQSVATWVRHQPSLRAS